LKIYFLGKASITERALTIRVGELNTMPTAPRRSKRKSAAIGQRFFDRQDYYFSRPPDL